MTHVGWGPQKSKKSGLLVKYQIRLEGGSNKVHHLLFESFLYIRRPGAFLSKSISVPQFLAHLEEGI